MITSIIVSLLVGLLGTFLDWLFKQWLNSGSKPGALGFRDAKPLFLAKVQKKWWYGPKRMDLASRLYEKAMDRYLSNDPKYLVDTSSDAATGYAELAKRLVAGLTP